MNYNPGRIELTTDDSGGRPAAVSTPAPTLRSTTELCEVYGCATCGTKRVWGAGGMRAGRAALPPNPTPVLRCAGRCGTTTPHVYILTRPLTVTRQYAWGRTEAGDVEARVARVEWRGEGEEGRL